MKKKIMSNDKKEMKELKLALLKAQQDIERLSKVKSDFISIISHELRTPLTSIKESVSLILDGIAGPLNEDQKRLLTITKNNIARLTNIIVNILDFSKLESSRITMRKKKVNINDVIRDVYAEIRGSAEKKELGFDLKLSDNLEPTWIDPERINQALKNLVSNGIKFNRQKGMITIYSSRERVNGRDFVQVAVEDTGAGISNNDLPKLFKEFNSLDTSMTRSYDGVGLGLAICKNIIRLHGGEIWVESGKDTGSRFMFTLPIYKKDDEFNFLLDWTLERAKSNDLKLSLIVLGFRNPEDKNERAVIEAEKTIQSVLKGPEDRVIRFKNGGLIALMASTDRKGAEKILKRMKEKIKVSLNFGMSVYPDEADTKEDLVKKAEEEITCEDNLL